MHIFKYSKRKGTVAAKMPGQVPDSIKAQRSNILLEMEEKHSKEFRAVYLGKEAEVLFEEGKEIDGKLYQIGHTRDYVKVALQTEEDLANQIRTVKVDAFLNNEILNGLKFSDK
jgi:threonylcarbamoyladenosine tRNA methylthiotransferase MtaB